MTRHAENPLGCLRSMRRWRSRPVVKLAALALFVQALPAPPVYAQQFGDWSPAVSVDPGGVIGVNTAVNEGCPMESPDGGTLFFASNRQSTANDIWVSVRAGEEDPWGTPVRLPTPVNSATANDFCPTPLPGNRLLFVSTRNSLCGGVNSADIYFTGQHPVQGWLEPRHLGCNVNSAFEEFSPSLVEAEGLTMLFFSSNRLGTHDIFVSLLQDDGSWSPAEPVAELNSPFQDARPNVRKDGLEVVFDSTRDEGMPELYIATRSSVFDPWSQAQRLGPNVNATGAAETRASFSRDGTRLYFGSNRGPGQGSNDIYVSTRAGRGKD